MTKAFVIVKRKIARRRSGRLLGREKAGVPRNPLNCRNRLAAGFLFPDHCRRNCENQNKVFDE